MKLYNEVKKKLHVKHSGLITENFLKPLSALCQIGTVVDFGKGIRDVQIGDTLMFHHNVSNEDDRMLAHDDEGEYRVVLKGFMNNEMFGVIRNIDGKPTMIPERGYVIGMHSPDDERHTRGVYQIPLGAFNPDDVLVQEMNLEEGDWLLCAPNSAYVIRLDQTDIWFIHADDIIAVNKGHHAIKVIHKQASKILKQSLHETEISLN